MKKVILVFTLVALATITQAQSFAWGLTLGTSTSDIDPAKAGSLLLKGQTDSLSLMVSKGSYGFHFGAFARFKISSLFIQPEVLFNSSKVDFRALGFGTIKNTFDSLQSATYQNIDIPVIFGAKYFNFLRIGVGPVAHVHLAGSTLSAKDFIDSWPTATYGYQAGIGIDLGHIGLDFRYEGNFSNFGSQITFGGTSYQFATTPSRLIGSLNIAF